MKDRDYYPAGAYSNPNAPYNEVEYPEIEVTAEVTVLLAKKNVCFFTDQYTEDDDGYKDLHIRYKDVEREISKQCNSISDMLAELVKYIKSELDAGAKGQRKQYLEGLLADAQGWEQTDMEIEDYNAATK